MITTMVSPKRILPTFSFILSLAALFLVIGLVWAMILEERRTRSLSLQFDIYRASAALVEAWLDNPEGNLVGGPVLGFGVYDADGNAITAQGSAPPQLDRGARSFVLSESGPGGATIRLMRPMPAPGGPSRLQGMQGGMMRGGYGAGGGLGGRGSGGGGLGSGGLGADGFGSSMGGMMGPPGLGASPGSPLGLLFASPRTMWLEYAVPPRPLGETVLVAGGLLLSLVLVGIYLLVLVLMRRNGELKERESRNRELAELGQAARTLVHEIKNPLGVIGIQAATLRRREGENSLAGKAADVIDGEVRRLAGMADRIREFLKAGPGDPRDIELLDFMRAFVERHDPEAGEGRSGIDLSLPTGDRGAMVRVDPDRLSLALDNLVANAREADPEGWVTLEVVRKGRSWVMAVGDRGGGVAPDSRARLFEPFFTTKEKGSGIGLALARSVARGAGGDLTYSPRPEGGSLFLLSLPALN
ncbi:MAG TPA: HAMP domain-containing sensor histidine kinase [Rectinemataceae bacterium]|nr:HAMP domain-containing sensor histidine kinase [Rectinemataceae bacterium]